jgi:hypothetical protein
MRLDREVRKGAEIRPLPRPYDTFAESAPLRAAGENPYEIRSKIPEKPHNPVQRRARSVPTDLRLTVSA